MTNILLHKKCFQYETILIHCIVQILVEHKSKVLKQVLKPMSNVKILEEK